MFSIYSWKWFDYFFPASPFFLEEDCTNELFYFVRTLVVELFQLVSFRDHSLAATCSPLFFIGQDICKKCLISSQVISLAIAGLACTFFIVLALSFSISPLDFTAHLFYIFAFMLRLLYLLMYFAIIFPFSTIVSISIWHYQAGLISIIFIYSVTLSFCHIPLTFTYILSQNLILILCSSLLLLMTISSRFFLTISSFRKLRNSALGIRLFFFILT